MKSVRSQHQNDHAAHFAELDRQLDALDLPTHGVGDFPTAGVARTAQPATSKALPHKGAHDDTTTPRREETTVVWHPHLSPMAQLAESTMVVNDPAGRLPRRRTPRRWLDLSTKQRVQALSLALPSLGSTAAFSLDLDHAIEAKARVQDSAASFLSEAIGRWTFRLLGRRVVLLFELEEATRRHRLHLHGAANVEPHELKLFRQALRKAGGEWDKNRQFQAHTKLDPDAGWARYTSKGSVWLIKDGPQDKHVGRRIKGEHYAASQKLRGAAQALYTEARKLLMSDVPDKTLDDTQVNFDLPLNETDDVADLQLPSSPSLTHEATATTNNKRPEHDDSDLPADDDLRRPDRRPDGGSRPPERPP